MALPFSFGDVAALAAAGTPIEAAGFAGTLFLHLPSLAITLGGTMAATLIQHPLSSVAAAFRACRAALSRTAPSAEEEVKRLTRFVARARREGLLAIEAEALGVEDPFLAKGLRLVLDGAPRGTILEILENEHRRLREKSAASQRVLESMAAYAPAFGMIGTLIGLVQLLRSIGDTGALGAGMATALLTTLYGALASNLVFLPLAGKLEARGRDEAAFRDLAIAGVLSLEAREAPILVEERLAAFFEPPAPDREPGSREAVT